jgi:Fe-S-cluster containining protein
MPTRTTRRKGRRATRPAATAPRPAAALVPRCQVPCGLCGLCCTYVTADIAPPQGVASASRILWYLYHPGVSVYRDSAKSWLVQFETRCRFFRDDRSCAIYARRPQVCRDFDARECEVNAPDEGLTFGAPEAFLAWLARRKPVLHARLLASGLVPPAADLRGAPPARAPLAPFAQRYAALRALGAPGATDPQG